MKYIITESQLYRVVFRYLDIHRFIKIENEDEIYFVHSENNEFSEITYQKKYKVGNVDNKLISLISDFFSLDFKDAKEIIRMWVEHTLQMRVYDMWPANKDGVTSLRIKK